MKLWRLTPIDLAHNDWRASYHTEPVIVRAPSAEIALEAASLTFGQMTQRVVGQPIAANPWHAGLVQVDEMDRQSEWSPSGPVEILSPPDHNEWVARSAWLHRT